jgi:Aspartate carbamoyltransferase, catalytic chain
MKIGRIRIGLNVVVQIVLILFLAAMVNSLAFKHYKRWDFSRDQKYALSDKTKRFLDTLKGKMRITVFFSPSTPISADLQYLLTEYQYAGKERSTSSKSIRSGVFLVPRSCSINTRSSRTKAFWCSTTTGATKQ